MPYEFPVDTADLLALGDVIDANSPDYGFLPVDDGANDGANETAMNLIRAAIQIERVDIPPTEVARVLNRVEFSAAAESDREWIKIQLDSGGLIDARTGSEQRSGFLGIFAGGTATRDSLQALLTEDGSRLQELFAQGVISKLDSFTVSTPSQIRAARA